MKLIIDLIDNYYESNLEFDQKHFLDLINILINELKHYRNSEKLNLVLNKILVNFERNDYYFVMQTIEYELLPMLVDEET